MATGTLTRLAIAIGIDDSQVTSGIMRTRGSILSGLASIGAQAEAQSAKTAAGIERTSNASLANVGKYAVGAAALIATVVAGLGALAIQFETETSHIAASAGITSQQASKIGKDYLDAAGKSQTMIFSAKDMTDSYAAVAGQLALADSKVAVYTQDMVFMKAATDLAAGSNSSLADASNAVASVIQNFQLKVSDSASAANVLFDASRGLNMSLGDTADTMEKLRGRLGTGSASLKDTATLMEIMATNSLSGQRNIILFTSALNNMLSKAADPTKVVAAQAAVTKEQDKVTAAQQRYDAAVSKSGVSSGQHLIDLQKLQDAESRYQFVLAKYGPQTVQTQSALVAVENAQTRVTAESTKGSAAVTSAAIALKTAQDNLAAAQLKLNGFANGNNAILAKLGVTVYDAKGNFVGMRTVIGELHNAFAKLNPEQQRYYASQLFSAPAAGAMIGIINGGVAVWDKYAANVGKATSAHQGALSATDNLAAGWKRFTAAAGAQATLIALQVAPFIQQLINFGTQALPVLASGFQFAFGVAKTAISDAWVVAGPIFNFFGSHQQLLLALLAAIAAKIIITKALKFGTELASWVAPVVRLVNDPLPRMAKLIGMGENGSINGGLKSFKANWADAFQAGNLNQVKMLATDMETASGKVDFFNTQLKTLESIKVAHPSLDISGWESQLTEFHTKAITELQGAIDAAATNSHFGNLLATDATKALGDQRFVTAMSGVSKNLESVVKDSIDKGAADAAPNLAKNIVTDIPANMTSALQKGITDAKVGDTVVSEVSKGGGVIAKALSVFGKIPGVGKVAGIASAALSQPVFVTNWPLSFMPGGNLVSDAKNLVSGKNVATDAEAVAKGLNIANKADAAGTSIVSSPSSKVVNAIETSVAKLAPAEVAAGTSVVADTGATAVGTGLVATITDAVVAPLAAAAAPVAAVAAGLTAVGFTVAGALGHGPLAGLYGMSHQVTQPSQMPQAGIDTSNSLAGLGVSSASAQTIANFQMKQPWAASMDQITKNASFQVLSSDNQRQDMEALARAISQGKIKTEEQFLNFSADWALITNASGGVVPSADHVLSYMDYIDKNVTRIFPQVITDFTHVQTSTSKIPPAIDRLGSTINTTITKIPDNLNNAPTIMSQVNTVLSNLPSDLQSTLNKVNAAFGAIAPTPKQVNDAVNNILGLTPTEAGNLLKGIAPVGKNSWDSLFSGVTSDLTTVGGNLSLADQASNAFNLAMEATAKPDLWAAIISPAQQTGPTMGSVLQQAQYLLSNISSAKDAAAIAANDLWKLPQLWAGSSPTGTPNNGPSGNSVNNPNPWGFARGGWLTEPVLGVGKSGRHYSFAEHESEMFTPASAINAARVRGMTGSAVLSTPPAGTSSTIEHLEVHNPIPEPASESVDKRLRRLSFTGLQ